MQSDHKRLRYAFLNFEKLSFFRGNFGLFGCPVQKMDGNLRKALDVNCLLLEGKCATTNRSLVIALNVKTSKMMKFSEKMAFFRPHSAPWWIFLT